MLTPAPLLCLGSQQTRIHQLMRPTTQISKETRPFDKLTAGSGALGRDREMKITGGLPRVFLIQVRPKEGRTWGTRHQATVPALEPDRRAMGQPLRGGMKLGGGVSPRCEEKQM
jgi:hypothetical protein